MNENDDPDYRKFLFDLGQIDEFLKSVLTDPHKLRVVELHLLGWAEAIKFRRISERIDKEEQDGN